jgi:hypothetical protein
MRLLPALLFTSSALASAPDLTDIDVAAIANVTENIAHAAPLSIGAPSVACTYTAEAGCTLEVIVAVQGWSENLIVSKIDGAWTLGKWELERIAVRRCLNSLSQREAKEDAQGLPIDWKKRREDFHACFPPSGHWGGMRDH